VNGKYGTTALNSVIMNGQGKNSTSTTLSLLVQGVSYSDLMEHDVPPPVRIESSGVGVCVNPFEVQAIKITVPRKVNF
jgi:hypothetical protein